MKKFSLIVAAAAALLLLGSILAEDLFPSLAKSLEASERWEFTRCFPNTANIWLLEFKDRNNGMSHHIRVVNQFHKQAQGATAKERLVKIQSWNHGISFNDTIPPNGSMEKDVVRLMRTALATSDNETNKAYMERELAPASLDL